MGSCCSRRADGDRLSTKAKARQASIRLRKANAAAAAEADAGRFGTAPHPSNNNTAEKQDPTDAPTDDPTDAPTPATGSASCPQSADTGAAVALNAPITAVENPLCPLYRLENDVDPATAIVRKCADVDINTTPSPPLGDGVVSASVSVARTTPPDDPPMSGHSIASPPAAQPQPASPGQRRNRGELHHGGEGAEQLPETGPEVLAADGTAVLNEVVGDPGRPALPVLVHSHPHLVGRFGDRGAFPSMQSLGGGWRCDGCNTGCQHAAGEPGTKSERFRCTRGCDFDVCGGCIATVPEGAATAAEAAWGALGAGARDNGGPPAAMFLAHMARQQPTAGTLMGQVVGAFVCPGCTAVYPDPAAADGCIRDRGCLDDPASSMAEMVAAAEASGQGVAEAQLHCETAPPAVHAWIGGEGRADGDVEAAYGSAAKWLTKALRLCHLDPELKRRVRQLLAVGDFTQNLAFRGHFQPLKAACRLVLSERGMVLARRHEAQKLDRLLGRAAVQPHVRWHPTWCPDSGGDGGGVSQLQLLPAPSSLYNFDDAGRCDEEVYLHSVMLAAAVIDPLFQDRVRCIAAEAGNGE